MPAEELDPDILEAIQKKFNAVFSVGTELADLELIKQGFEPFKDFSFCPIIEPSYDDASHIVIVDHQEPICYLHEWHKAWDFHFGSLQDLASGRSEPITISAGSLFLNWRAGVTGPNFLSQGLC